MSFKKFNVSEKSINKFLNSINMDTVIENMKLIFNEIDRQEDEKEKIYSLNEIIKSQSNIIEKVGSSKVVDTNGISSFKVVSSSLHESKEDSLNKLATPSYYTKEENSSFLKDKILNKASEGIKNKRAA